MVTLLGLNQYSRDQLAQAEQWSPAFSRYAKLLGSLPHDDLHAIRHHAWLRCVAATYFNTSPTADICTHWSQTADTLLSRVWIEVGLHEHNVALFALGKQGAEELNLSSDIDVMVVTDDRDPMSVERLLRRFQARLQGATANGFCFRLDFDLRPGGKLGPLLTTPTQFQDHYWSQGETWERLALVRLRAITGPAVLVESIADLARRFCYRKFLDYNLLDDLKALRSEIHQKSFQRKDHELHVKLEIGGIRDIELFVHSLLILNGGKIPELQTHSTTRALHHLQNRKLLSTSEADQLLASYWNFRHVENTLQSIDDRQTHSLTAAETALPRMPTLAHQRLEMAQVDHVVTSLLGHVDLAQARLPQTLEAQMEWLLELGFGDETVSRIWEPLTNATALSHKNARDERARREFLFSFVTELSGHKNLDRDLGLKLLLDFVRATRAKATFFVMLLRSPRLIQDLARLFCLSPYLGSIVASRPELLDHFVLQLDEAWSEDAQVMLQQMSERKQLTELWAANQYLADRDLPAKFKRITRTADAIATQLLQQLKSEFRTSTLEIIALGKWAGEEMGLRSDLDFLFVTPGTPNDDDFKVARRFISRLTDPSKAGSLYEIDLRLRPSGQSGPLLVSLAQLNQYWAETAQPWERQAYLRARCLTTPLDLHKSALTQRELSAEERAELREIRQKLLKSPSDQSLDVKYAPGGLLEIEFAVQTAVLRHRTTCWGSSTDFMADLLIAANPGWHTPLTTLKKLYLQLRTFEQMLQLSSAHTTTEAKMTSETFTKASGLCGMKSDQAWAQLEGILAQSREILSSIDC